MAFAIASGVNPEYGIYTTIIAGLIVALIGGSHFQIAGPTGAFIPILLAIVLQYGYEDLLIAGMIAGVMLVFMAVFKFGSLITYISRSVTIGFIYGLDFLFFMAVFIFVILITYIPRPVTIGFTSGIAVIIFSGQLENFLGLENIEKKQYFHQNMLEIIQHLPSVNVYSILIAILGVLLVI